MPATVQCVSVYVTVHVPYMYVVYFCLPGAVIIEVATFSPETNLSCPLRNARSYAMLCRSVEENESRKERRGREVKSYVARHSKKRTESAGKRYTGTVKLR